MAHLVKGIEMPSDTPSLYAPYFTEEERRDLEAVPHDDLTGEIFLQRHLLVLVMSRSPSGPLEFELLLEKTRACNLAIRSLVSLIYAELELRKGRTPDWKLFVEAAHLLSAEELGIVEDVFPDDVANAIRTGNPYWIRYMEMEASFDDPGELTLPKGEGRGWASEQSNASVVHRARE